MNNLDKSSCDVCVSKLSKMTEAGYNKVTLVFGYFF